MNIQQLYPDHFLSEPAGELTLLHGNSVAVGGSGCRDCGLRATGKLAPSGVESRLSEGDFNGSVVNSKHLKLIGTCPVVQVGMGGVQVSCLLDTGSMVTTIAKGFSTQHSWDNKQLQKCSWLQLRTANSLEIPYLGYIEIEMKVLGKTLPHIGVLVVRDPLHPVSQANKAKVPGLLGMNVISGC